MFLAFFAKSESKSIENKKNPGKVSCSDSWYRVAG